MDGENLLTLIGSAALLGLGGLLLARSLLHVVTVNGDSMTPTYSDGDQLLVLRRWTVRRTVAGACSPTPPATCCGSIPRNWTCTTSGPVPSAVGRR